MQVTSNDNKAVAESVELQVRRLLAAGKCKQAVELAKDHHKKANSAESQRLIFEAYVARVEEFQKKGMLQEAQTLLTLVRQRFPEQRHELATMEVRAAAMGGRIDELLRPLASDQTPVEIRSSIDRAITRYVTDLSAVAGSRVLPENHPLRLGAAATWRAFLAVTIGPVSDSEIELSQISYRSPLSPWKMLIRALASFYRGDDSGARRSLESIPADAAIAPAAAALRSLLDRSQPAAGIAAALYKRVTADDQVLLSAMNAFERALDGLYLDDVVESIRQTTRACSRTHPELLDRLMQHISVRCYLHDVPGDAVITAMGHSKKDSYFWRLLARAVEGEGSEALAAILWQRFLRHATHEKLFAESGMEAAAVWLHMAGVLGRLSLEQLESSRDQLAAAHLISDYYAAQPPEIKAIWNGSDAALAHDVLEPGRPFQRAAQIRPEAEVFQQWWEWAAKVGLPDKQQEDIAQQWHAARPRDAQPLLHLSVLAEQRNALSLALKRLGEAEAIDPLNQLVRKARLRLTLSMTWRHFADRKPHLVEKDLAELGAMAAMNEGDRAALLESVRAAWHELRGDQPAQMAARQSVLQRMGELAGPVLLHSIRLMAKLDNDDSLLTSPEISMPAVEVAQASARLMRLLNEVRLRLWVPLKWEPFVLKTLHQRPCPLSDEDALLIGRAAVATSDFKTGYAASSAGLSRTTSPGYTARFLLLRARSLNASWHRPRTTQCMRAALELARQSHDQQLIDEVFATIDRDPFARRIVVGAREGSDMSEQVLQQVLTAERKADEQPRSPMDADAFVIEAAQPQVGGRFGVPSPVWDDEEDFDDDDADDSEAGLFDSVSERSGFDPDAATIPVEIVEAMKRAVENGELPDDPMVIVRALAAAAGLQFNEQEMLEMAKYFEQGSHGGHGTLPGNARRASKRRR